MDIKRASVSFLIGTFVPGIAWIGGMDFVRGPDLAMAVGFGIALSAASYTCPFWELGE